MKNSNSITESAIIDGCRKKEIKAQRAFYDLFGPQLMSICLRYVKPTESAEEIFNDVMLKIFAQFNKYEQKGSLIGWAKRLAVNVCLDHIRKEKNKIRINYLEDELLEVEDKVDDEALLENANAELVFQLIEELPTQQKLVLNMFVMEDFSHKEIANRLAISEGASRSLV